MVIEGSFYRLTPVNEHSAFFDLELLHEIKGKNPRKEFKTAAYGLTLDKAMNAIVRYAVNNTYKDEIVNLKQYIDEFAKQRKAIRAEFGIYSE